jgi:hypothetical protein
MASLIPLGRRPNRRSERLDGEAREALQDPASEPTGARIDAPRSVLAPPIDSQERQGSTREELFRHLKTRAIVVCVYVDRAPLRGPSCPSATAPRRPPQRSGRSVVAGSARLIRTSGLRHV